MKKDKLVFSIMKVYREGKNASVYFDACVYGQDTDPLTFWATVRPINDVNILIICRAGGGEAVCGEIEEDDPKQSIVWVVDDFIEKYDGKVGKVIDVFK